MMIKHKNKDFMRLLDLRVKPEDDRGGEAGRSMVEMLGVLAVVGVLSVGGIAGYTYAMNKYYANELLAGASERAVLVTAQLASGREPSLKEFAKHTTAGGTFATNDESVRVYSDGIGIEVSGVKGAVCKNLIEATEGTDIIIADTNDVALTEDGCDDENTLILTFETGIGGGAGSSSSSGYLGPSGDEEGAVCSGTRPGECSVCRKNYVDATSGEWFDSDALCTTPGHICVDGNCVSSAVEEPTFTGPMCKCLYNGDDYFCGENDYRCVTDDDCRQFGTWDEDSEECVFDGTFCTNNRDCTSDEYCHYTSVDSDTCKPTQKGTCMPKADAKGDFASGTTAEAAGFIRSSGWMDWFSAQNFCRSYGKNLVTLSQVGYIEGDTYWPPIIAKFGDEWLFWTADLEESCEVSTVNLEGEDISFTPGITRASTAYALCK